MIIACPNCDARYKVDPAKFKGETITFRCRKCERRLKFDKQVVKSEKTTDEMENMPDGIEHVTETNVEENTELQDNDTQAEKLEDEGDESPVLSPEQKSESKVETTARSSVDRRKKILVADDELSICILVDEILSNAGYTVITASDGLEAYEKIRAEKPDLVVLDLLMPKMTGFEVLKELRKENKDLPVLVMTAIYKKASQVLVVKELGANGYLEKPFSSDHLLFRIDNLIMAAAQKE